jgi:uncharacterized membrane protein YphA (DoxX/SURF4 family)
MLQRCTFRFALIYLLLYILPFPIDVLQSMIEDIREIVTGQVPDPDQKPVLSQYVLKPYEEFWHGIVLRVGKEAFGVEIEYRPLGSGDTTWNYVQVFVFAVLSASLAAFWSLSAGIVSRVGGRSSRGYYHLFAWLQVLVRFYLAQKMVVYGSVKVIKLQFQYPGPDTLLHTYGESSPMHLLWTFMGASDEYTWFTGAGELLAGALLCTRRTTLLGAIVAFGVMAHVVALNFCYDVPVKLFSSHLALMSLVLIAPHVPWLLRAFVLGQAVTVPAAAPLVARRWLDWVLFVIRSLLVVSFVGLALYGAHEKSTMYGRDVPEPPLFGLWDVEEFTLDGTTRPPLTTDAGRWQRVCFYKPRTFRKTAPGKPSLGIVNMVGKRVLTGELSVDQDAHTITLTRPDGPPESAKPPIVNVLQYTETQAGTIEVEGVLDYTADGKPGAKRVRVRLRHYGPDKFLLSSRGFHWINEVPYNRFGPRTEDPPKNPPPPKRP